LLRLAPYAYAMVTSTLRVLNAKAKRELGWAPSYPTYRQGIEKVTKGDGILARWAAGGRVGGGTRFDVLVQKPPAP
jgi:hypothetical protein